VLLQDIITFMTVCTLVNNVPIVTLHTKLISFTMVTVVTRITMITSAAKFTVDFLFTLVVMVISAAKLNCEVRNPRSVNQITTMADVQSKHNYIYYSYRWYT